MKRRTFHRWLALGGLIKTQALISGRAQAAEPAKPTPQEAADAHHRQMLGEYAALTDGPKLTIGLLVYPGMFLQDLVGPLTVFEALMNREIHLLWKDLEPVGNEDPKAPALIPVRPTTRFSDCPAQLDVLFVPGGVPGTLTVMQDPQVLQFLADRGKTARFVTSVCTGSLILGAAGLLNGYKATSYWSLQDLLKDFGAIPTPGRVVIDRNRITGGGVTAGIDFGLHLVGMLRSPTYAQAVQLYLEYDPAPPFDAGSPAKAPALVVRFLTDMFGGLRKAVIEIGRKARG